MLGIGVGDAQSRSKNVQLMLESNMMEACCYLHDSTGLHFNTTLFPQSHGDAGDQWQLLIEPVVKKAETMRRQSTSTGS